MYEDAPVYEIEFWDFWASDGVEPALLPTHSLGDLFNDDLPAGEVRIAGQFRGRNAWADKQTEVGRGTNDWILRDGPWSVWVTGETPRGGGWRLTGDRLLARAVPYTSTWLMVTGRAERRDGDIFLRGSEVEPIRRPAVPEPGASGGVKGFGFAPPELQFTIPGQGIAVASDGQFRLQFTKHMRSDTLEGRVRLRYAGDPRPDDPGIDGVSVLYFEGRKLLQIDPGVLLEPGREIEVQLLPGIRDITGLALGAEASSEGALITLRWRVRP